MRLLDTDGNVLTEGDVTPEWGDPWYPNGPKCDSSGCSLGVASL